jgi:hypothetical protein
MDTRRKIVFFVWQAGYNVFKARSFQWRWMNMDKQTWKAATTILLVLILLIRFPSSAESKTEDASSLGAGRNSIQIPSNWLDRLNYYREAAGLPPIPESTAYSDDLDKHVSYMLLNVPTEGLWHGETPGHPGYTPEGNQAAAESNLYWYPSGASYGANPAMSIDGWMASNPHRYGMLNPDLVSTGFSFGCDNENCGAGLNVIHGIDWGVNPKPNGVFYPGQNQKDVNTDITITWQFHSAPTVILKSASLKDSNGQPIAFTTTTPADGDYFNMVSVKPKSSLASAMSYVVSITVQLDASEISQTWSFTTSGGSTFTDVPLSHPYFSDIEILYANGLTGGCSTTPLKYCPDDIMDRGQAAVFMVRGKFGSGFFPSPATHVFKDDWSKGDWAESWAEAMFYNGLSAGCQASPRMFCPWDKMPREQAVIFALRMKYGTDYVPPAATGTLFADMTDASYWATPWAEQAYKDGLIPNCGMSGGKPMICPKTLVTRGLGAYMIVKAKNLTMP